MTRLLTTVVFVSALLAGCQTMTPTQTALAQIAVQRAVYEVVKDHPERPAKIVQIASEVEALASGDTATTPAILEQIIRGKIDFEKLSPPDRQMVDSLLTLLRSELEVQLSKVELPQDKPLAVKAIASWVKQTAQLYVSE